MTNALLIIILIVIFFWLVWPSVARWLKRKTIEKMQESILRQMGMPPPPKEKRKRREKTSGRGNNPGPGMRSPHSGPIIPKEYAEDVEFVEIKEYSETTVETRKGTRTEIYHESQVSDAEWVEIKSARAKQDR